jgi:DNA helicase-2/ATP-dependent DNA helicase PcrA
MKLTLQQEEIITDISSGTGNLVCDARAGSAKTTTSVLGINETDPSLTIVCCAFNRRIADTLAEKMPEHAMCKTLNALGHGAWRKRISDKYKVQVKTDKSWRIQKELNMGSEFPDLRRLIGLVKANGIVPSGALGDGRGVLPDDPAIYRDLIEDADLDVGFCPDPIGVTREAMLKSIKMAWKGDIDFDDQLYMSVCFQGQLPKADMVLNDEAQDDSPIQLRMMEMMLKDGARFIAVGDRFQAIYAFRGADCNSIDNIINRFDAHTRLLTTSFRCPRTVVYKAQEYVPDIEPWDQAPEGQVVMGVKDYDKSLFVPGSVILCRNTAPLIKLCFKLISSGVGAAVVGKEIGENLVKLVKKVGGNTTEELCGRMNDYVGAEVQRLTKINKTGQAALLEDKAEAIYAVCGLLGIGKDIEDLIDAIVRMFRDQSAVIKLSTIHKAKGLEWPYVFFLDRYLIPSRYAKTQQAIQQETNLAYVAVTRAQKVLTFIDSEGFRG